MECNCENCYKIINLLEKIDPTIFDDVGFYCKKCNSIIYQKNDEW